jgi:hypothetical protein
MTVLRQYLRQGVHSLIVLATDGGANDGKGVEVTGTSDGSINVTLVGGAVGGQTVKIAVGTHVGSSALEKRHIVSNAACTLRSAKAINSGMADLYLFVIDAAALPGDGATPSRIPIPVPAGSVNGDVWQGGTALSNGCVLALSSTLATLTLVASDVGWFDAEINT